MSQTATEQSEHSGEETPVAASVEQADAAGESQSPTPSPAAAGPLDADQPPSAAAMAANLPAHARSFFRVTAPVSVNLAHKKESVREIVEMAPGSILTFDKGCEELLELAIGDRVIAVGEAVKIGDKFGFRVVKIVPPEEQFRVVAAEARAQAAAARTPAVINLAGS